MIKLFRAIVCIGVFSLGLASAANADLEARLGGLAVYDTDLNITWLSDANYAQTSGYDADGRMNWNDAMTWAASLNVSGVSGWRLPKGDQACGPTFYCTNGEMGHLFYNELGGTAWSSILTSSDPDLALFANIQGITDYDEYWSGTMDYSDPSYLNTVAFGFRFYDGWQDTAYKWNNLYAWAVHDGDVALIPEPEIYAMMSIGLLAVFGFGRLRQQS